MKEKNSLQDLQLISAYLDHACSAEETLQVESRLKTDTEFAQLFREIAYARRLLRALPLKRAPRNFTLSAAQAKVRRPRRIFFPLLNFASAAAACLLAVMLIWPQWFLPTREAAVPTVALFAASATETGAVEATPTPMIFTWEGSYNTAKGMGGGGGNGNPAASSYSANDYLPITESTEEPMMSLGAPASTDDQGSGGSSSNNPILGIAAPADQGQIQPSATAEITVQTTAAETVPETRNSLLLYEIILGAVALISALAAWRVRR